MPLYAFGPLEGLRIRRLMGQMDGYHAPAAIEAAWAEHVPGGPATGLVADLGHDTIGDPEPVLA
jgi:hypothetical protein